MPGHIISPLPLHNDPLFLLLSRPFRTKYSPLSHDFRTISRSFHRIFSVTSHTKMSDRLDSSPSRLDAQLSFMDQYFDFDGASTGQEGDWSPFETNRALDTSPIGLSTNDNPVNAKVAPATGTTPSTMIQSPDFGNALDNALAINPAQLQGVPHAGNASDTITHFPSGQFLDNFAMTSDGHSSFDLAQMGYMQTPWNLAPLFSGNETVTSQSISVPSQLHHPNLVDGSSAGAL